MKVLSREALCPECHYPLSVSIDKDKKGEIKIKLFCEWCDSEQFFEILTGLKNRDFKKLIENTKRKNNN